MAKKTNPNRIPKTQADVDRAHRFGCYQGSEVALVLLVYTLCDMGMGDEVIEKLWDGYKYNVESMRNGYMNLNDVRRTLETERHIKFDEVCRWIK